MPENQTIKEDKEEGREGGGRKEDRSLKQPICRKYCRQYLIASCKKINWLIEIIGPTRLC